MIKTAECVSPKHPDKICDLIADSVLDAYLECDPYSRVAVEVLGGHGHVAVTGEVTSKADVDIEGIVHSIVGKCGVSVHIEKQSPYIAGGVDTGGAGDQGIMVGYACGDTDTYMPREYELARGLCRKVYKYFPYDGKTQVTLDGEATHTVVVSFQNAPKKDLERIVRSCIDAEEYIINPAGDWDVGGFDADSGLSGRKIVIDAYGPHVCVGGGAFSGKDATKVDRSGAYVARKIAREYLILSKAEEVYVYLGYAIGKSEPVMATVHIDGVERAIDEKYDLTPDGIIETLDLRTPRFRELSAWGHFGRETLWG